MSLSFQHLLCAFEEEGRRKQEETAVAASSLFLLPPSRLTPYAPSSHEVRYFRCSSVSSSIPMPMAESLSRATSWSISLGTTCTSTGRRGARGGRGSTGRGLRGARRA